MVHVRIWSMSTVRGNEIQYATKIFRQQHYYKLKIICFDREIQPVALEMRRSTPRYAEYMAKLSVLDNYLRVIHNLSWTPFLDTIFDPGDLSL